MSSDKKESYPIAGRVAFEGIISMVILIIKSAF